MRRPKLPKMVHAEFTIDDGWNWRDEMEWHHEEYKIPYEFLVYDSRRDTFTLSKAMDKRVRMLAYSWLPDKIVKGDYCNIKVIEYETLKELEAIRKRMNKYGFHTDINGEFDEE